ncbi:MAG: MFS transporter, partial [Verrucomicrobiota bacterium]
MPDAAEQTEAPVTPAQFPTPAFVRYMIGEGISMTGTWMQAMAGGWVMASLTTSATMLGLVNLMGGLPMIALAMTGGLFADKFDKRFILQVCQVVQIILSLTLGYLVGQHSIEMWHIFLAA